MRWTAMFILIAMLVVACGGDNGAGAENAFDGWSVSPDRVPDYEITDTMADEPDALLAVQVENTGWTEDEAKQVFADVIEDNRDMYPVITIRAWGDGQVIGIYAETEDDLETIATEYGLDLDEVADYPALVFQS